MNKEFTDKLIVCISNCKKVLAEVKQRQAEERRINEELAKKKEQEEKEKKFFSIVGDLPSKLANAANKGMNWIDIDLPREDFDRNFIPRRNSSSEYAYNYLKTIAGLSVNIRSRQEEDSGAYNERLITTFYFLRIML